MKKNDLLNKLDSTLKGTEKIEDKKDVRAHQLGMYGDRIIVDIDLDELVPDPDQPRKIINQEGLEDLKRSIDSTGLQVPIIVRKKPDEENKFIIMVGHRRTEAFRQLGYPSIPATVTKKTRVLDIRKAQLAENESERLTVVEEAEAVLDIKRLLVEEDPNRKITLKDVAKESGKVESHIKWLSRINNLELDYKTYLTKVQASHREIKRFIALSEEDKQKTVKQDSKDSLESQKKKNTYDVKLGVKEFSNAWGLKLKLYKGRETKESLDAMAQEIERFQKYMEEEYKKIKIYKDGTMRINEESSE